jgi:hypothetical protein
MWWLTLRLHRAELILLLAVALVFTVAFVTTYGEVRRVDYPNGIQLACGAPFSYIGETGYCPDGTGSILPLLNESVPYVVFLPLALAIVMAFPLVMSLSSRTWRLPLVQSVTRADWIRTQLAVMVLVGLGLSGLAIALVRWWLPDQPIFESVRGYDAIGIVNLGWTLFAIGLAVATATRWRRPLVTLIITGGIYYVARIGFMYNVRSGIYPTERREEPLPFVGNLGENVWVTSAWYTGPAGQRVEDAELFDLCRSQPSNWETSCFPENGLTTRVWEYHPYSHYWPMQLTETGIFAAVGLALIGWTVWYWLRRLE